MFPVRGAQGEFSRNPHRVPYGQPAQAGCLEKGSGNNGTGSGGPGRVKLVNPMGGLVYVNVGKRSKRGRIFKVQISGATPAPLFILGVTTPEQWAAQLENCKAPWGKSACRAW